jgi:hypothetical protein
MCFSSGPDPAAAAAETERQRKAEIAAAQGRVEGIFSSPQREQQILDFIGSQRGYLQSDLDRQHKKNALQTKFATARSGLSGGSVDVDRNRLLAETYLRGIAEAERRAQNAGADLRSSDQQSKQQLFSQIIGGADASTAATNAAQMMRINAQQAGDDSYFNAFDSLFGDFGSIYKNSREAAGERRASQDYGSLFGPRPRTQASVAGGIYGG